MYRRYCSILLELVEYCYVHPEDKEGSAPHTVNQHILYNSHIAYVLFDVIMRNSEGVCLFLLFLFDFVFLLSCLLF